MYKEKITDVSLGLSIDIESVIRFDPDEVTDVNQAVERSRVHLEELFKFLKTELPTPLMQLNIRDVNLFVNDNLVEMMDDEISTCSNEKDLVITTVKDIINRKDFEINMFIELLSEFKLKLEQKDIGDN